MLDLKYSETRINWNPCLQPETIKLEFVIRLLEKKKKRQFSIETYPEKEGNLLEKRKAH